MSTKQKTNLSDLELLQLKKEISASLANDRQYLLVKHPFCGGILLRLNVIPVRDRRIRTAMTTGKDIYFSISYYASLTQEQRYFVLAHEVWHCVMLHFARLQTRDSKLFNIAADMEVNYLLSQDGLIPPKHLCWPPNGMEGSSAEEYYEYILKEKKNNNLGKMLKNMMPPSASSNGGDSDGDDSSDQSNSTNGKSKHNSNKPDDSDTPYGKQFDKHVYTDPSDEDNAEEDNMYDEYGEVGYDPDYVPVISSDTAERIREAVTAAAQRYERLKGSLPACYARYVNALRKPEISWKELLAQFVTSMYTGTRRWLPPARRHCYKELYLQSRRTERIKVTVAIDTSGSTSGDLPKFLTELIGLLNSFGGYDLTVIQCDCQVDSIEHYSDAEPFPLDHIEDFKFSGGGGSSTIPVFDTIEDEGIETTCLLYFTDGYIDAPKYPPPYPVLWLLTKDGDEKFCEWGTKIKFKHS